MFDESGREGECIHIIASATCVSSNSSYGNDFVEKPKEKKKRSVHVSCLFHPNDFLQCHKKPCVYSCRVGLVSGHCQLKKQGKSLSLC